MVIVAVFNHSLQRRFEDIRLELRQFVIFQVDERKIACRNNLELVNFINVRIKSRIEKVNHFSLLPWEKVLGAINEI